MITKGGIGRTQTPNSPIRTRNSAATGIVSPQPRTKHSGVDEPKLYRVRSSFNFSCTCFARSKSSTGITVYQFEAIESKTRETERNGNDVSAQLTLVSTSLEQGQEQHRTNPPACGSATSSAFGCTSTGRFPSWQSGLNRAVQSDLFENGRPEFTSAVFVAKDRV